MYIRASKEQKNIFQCLITTKDLFLNKFNLINEFKYFINILIT